MTVASQVKQCLFSLKNVQSELQMFALQTDDEKAKREFHESMMICENILNDLKNRIGELEREEPQYKGY